MAKAARLNAASWHIINKMESDGWDFRAEWKGAGREYAHSAEVSFFRWIGGVPITGHAVNASFDLAVAHAATQAATFENMARQVSA
jgi:hypothetical protein